MSRTKLPQKVVLQVWLCAGGRCEYPGCNEPLWKDTLTLQRMNAAYLAHIVADSPDGPRGDPTLSERLKDDPSNIMLLCDRHHRLVDIEDVAGHPVDVLGAYKKEHEERIERQTAVQTNRRTYLLLFGTRIGDRRGDVNYEQAREAVFPERYPADEKGIRLDLADNHVPDDAPDFWEQIAAYVERALDRYLADGIGPDGKALNHLSIFALAPIPALVHFGKHLGDIVSADVYQRQRSTGDWRWQDLDDDAFAYSIDRPSGAKATGCAVAVNLSLSGAINPTEIERALGARVPTYGVTIARPSRDFLRAKEQLEVFRNEWHMLLSEIRAIHGEECVVHLFPAVPCSIAVEIGRSLLPKSDPRLVVYDHDRNKDGFVRAMMV